MGIDDTMYARQWIESVENKIMEVLYMQPMFLKPVFKERIWGGTALQEEFGYEIPNDKTGE